MGEELKIVIADTTYSLVEIPRSNTQLVLDERDKILGHIDLKTLVEDLGRVGRCIRVAYNGVMAAGPQYNQLQIKIQDLGYDVTKLCDKSAITVSKFKRGCATILKDLRVTYRHLLGNFEGMALDTLEDVSDIAGQMAAAAKELCNDFDRQANIVREVANETKTEHAKSKITVENKEMEEKELKIRHEHQKEVLESARKEEQEAKAKLREYEMKEDEAIEGLGETGNFFTKLINGLTSIVGMTVFGEDESTKKAKLRQWKQKKLEALEKQRKREDMRRQAFQQLTEFAVSIEKCTSEKEMAKVAVDALHKAMDGLKMLAALMMQAAKFWELMQEHCKALGEDRIKKAVAEAMKYDKAQRREFWTSDGFKEQAVTFYAGWVALDGVCGEYMSGIRDTQKDLYKYITENPSHEEAYTNVKQLAAEFQRELGPIMERSERLQSNENSQESDRYIPHTRDSSTKIEEITPEDFQSFPEPTIAVLMEVAAASAELIAKWKAVGEGLGIQQCDLETINLNSKGETDHSQECMRKVFAKWHNALTSDYTWKKLAEVTMSPTVGNKGLLKKMHEQLKKKHQN